MRRDFVLSLAVCWILMICQQAASSTGRFDYGDGCNIGPQSPRGKVTEVTIPASPDEPVLVTVDNCTYAIDNALRNETTGEYLAGADWEKSPKVFNRDAPVPAPFIITTTTT
ncbi:hypothetical protein HYR99_35645 [Candidatus Poribacteria bacterium]|nr:hypothetical protein [Candidatus Poribacteria bacterium]